MSDERFAGKCPKCGGECQCVRTGQKGQVTWCAYCKEGSLTIDFKEVKPPRVSCPHCEREANQNDLQLAYIQKNFENHGIVCGYCGKQSKTSEWVERKPKETPAVETKYCTGCGLGKQRPLSLGICQVTCATCGRTAPWEDWSVTPQSSPPPNVKRKPLGIPPRSAINHNRRKQIEAAIDRFEDYEESIPQEWIDEWIELVGKLGKVAESELTSG